jgi:hypothetical protein
MEATCSSEMSVDTQRTTRRYIPEVDTFHSHRCETLKSYKRLVLSTRVGIVTPKAFLNTKYKQARHFK